MAELTIQQAFDLAVQHHQAGRLRQAEQLYRQILAQWPEHAGATHLLGVLAHQVGRNDIAVDLIRRAIALNPNYAEAHSNLGVALQDKGQLDEAIAAYRQAIALNPNLPEAHISLGDALRGKGQLDEAIAACRQAIGLSPTHADAHYNLGNALKDKGQIDEAIAAYRQAIALRPDYAEAHNNLGAALAGKGHFEEAVVAYRQAIALNPNLPEVHHNISIALLALGHFAEGWEEFESRLQLPWLRLNRGFSQPQWDSSDPAGKTVLLFTEGGFGDALQFIRLVPQATARGGRWFLECQPELVTLLDKTPGVERIIPRGQPLPEFDMQIPLQSLPRVLKITLENIPNKVPYLNPPADRVERWAAKLAGETRLRVGLAWAGNQGAKGDLRTRSIGVFAPLAAVEGVKFFSLQKGDGSEQPPPAGMNLADFSGELSDFADTAALVRNLDLVVTVDTSIAHLAGALARPVWVLIPFMADFRWLHKRTDSPWYPTMRLFRQATFGDWPSVISRNVEALAAFTAEQMTRPRNQTAVDSPK
jgi:tetratricopeptide (TPR) repeat protein